MKQCLAKVKMHFFCVCVFLQMSVAEVLFFLNRFSIFELVHCKLYKQKVAEAFSCSAVSPFTIREEVSAARVHSSTSLNEIDGTGRCHLAFHLLHRLTRGPRLHIPLIHIRSPSSSESCLFPSIQSSGVDSAWSTASVVYGFVNMAVR